MLLISAILIFCTGFVALYLRERLAPNFGSGSDNFGHLIRIRSIQENGHRQPPGTNLNEITSGYDAYPYLLHWVLSFFPKRRIDWVKRNISVLMDSLLWGLFGLLAVFGYLRPDELFVCLVLFVTTPEFFRPDRAQNHGLSARKPGLVLTTAVFLLFTVWTVDGLLFLLIPALLFGAAVYLTNKFSVQAFLFLVVGLSLFSSLSWAVFLIACFVIAILSSTGAYLKVLEGHVRHLYFYGTYLQFNHRKVQDKTIQPREILSAVDRWRRNQSSLKDVLTEMHNNIPVQALLNFPYLVPLGVALVYSSAASNVPGTFVVWTVGGVAAFAITSIPRVRFLGEPERYLEYVFLPGAYIVATGTTVLGPVYEALVYLTGIGGVVLLVGYMYSAKVIEQGKDEEDSFDEVLTFLASEPEGIVLLQPLNRAKELQYRTAHATPWWGGNLGSTPESLEEFKTLNPIQYPYITDDVEWLEERYDPDWVIFDTGRMDEHAGLTPPDGSEPIFESGEYEVYRFRGLCSS